MDRDHRETREEILKSTREILHELDEDVAELKESITKQEAKAAR